MIKRADNPHRRFKYLCAAMVSLPVLMQASTAMAQGGAAAGQASEADASDIGDDIIVTAQFREQRLQDTPLAITAFSGEEIDRKAMNNITDLSKMAPNVTITAGTGAAGSSAAIYIRGIGQHDANYAMEPGVGVYVDDVYHGALAGSIFDLLDLDRVEILRGPQGTLAGKNSIGGAVKLYSRKPQGSNDGYVQATVGSFSRIDLRGAFDLALTDTLAARVSAFSKRRDGHVTRLDFACDQPALAGTIPTQVNSRECKIGTMGAVRSTGVRAALRWTPTPDFEVNLAGALIRDDSEAAGAELIFAHNPNAWAVLGGVPFDTRFIPNRPYVNYATFDRPDANWHVEPQAVTHSQSLSGQVDWTISDTIKLTSITAYTDMMSVWSNDGDLSPIGIVLTIYDQPYHQFTQELRLNGDIGDNLVNWTVGGFYFDSLGRVGGHHMSGINLNHILDDPVKSTSKAVYAQVIVHPVPDMSLVGGVRYTDDKKSYTFYRAHPRGGPAPGVGSLSGTSGSYAGDSFDYRLGIDYRFSPEIMAYASISTGYKGGGINSRPFIPSQVVEFHPERSNAYEVGVKTDLFDRALRLNVAAFLNQYTDVILSDNNGYPGVPGDPDFFPQSAVPFNAGDADIKGVEVEAILRPTSGMSIAGSLSYIDFKYKTLDSNALASGMTLDFWAPYTPEWKWSVDALYDIDLANGARVTPQLSVGYTGAQYSDAVNDPIALLASHTTADATITFRSPNRAWQVVAGVTNLTDRHYYTNSVGNIRPSTGAKTAVVARPREFSLTIRREF